ncbi:hypothetical protein MQX03_00135 [Chryseobacterium aahli]|uniref:hypothetical protein n=1 Tax=Chryseobacterium aahli TaxID=1278643 RepID=UPI001F604275|nr:hypothetical protein [Chryseobacterium aahli]MCI3935590.1 hypothetical protein [Chryseobacterium aahli]
MTDLKTILSWFQTGDMPTQEEFQETFSSFRHNNTKIPIAEVDGLQSSLNNKVNVGDIIGGGGNFIPLTGTETGQPITGNLKVDTTISESEINIYNGDFNTTGSGLNFQQNGVFRLFNRDSTNNLESNIYLDPNYIRTMNTSGSKQGRVDVSSNFISLHLDNIAEETFIDVNLTQTRGLYSDQDLTPLYVDKSFVQKAYVDKQIQSTRKSLTNPAVLSGEVFYETIGNKAFVHFELPSLPIASDETLHFEGVDGITFKLTQRVIEIFGATKLLISSNNGGGIDIYNPGDSNTFSIFDTLVYFIDPPSPV